MRPFSTERRISSNHPIPAVLGFDPSDTRRGVGLFRNEGRLKGLSVCLVRQVTFDAAGHFATSYTASFAFYLFAVTMDCLS